MTETFSDVFRRLASSAGPYPFSQSKERPVVVCFETRPVEFYSSFGRFLNLFTAGLQTLKARGYRSLALPLLRPYASPKQNRDETSEKTILFSIFKFWERSRIIFPLNSKMEEEGRLGDSYRVLRNVQVGAQFALSSALARLLGTGTQNSTATRPETWRKLARHDPSLLKAVDELGLDRAGEGMCSLEYVWIPRGWGYRLQSRDGDEEVEPWFSPVELELLETPDSDLKRAFATWKSSPDPRAVAWSRVRDDLSKAADSKS